MAKVIILNGPPGVGKDTLASELQRIGVANGTLSFKDPIFDAVRGILSDRVYGKFLIAYRDRKLKETPDPEFGNLSPRGMMIHVSENVIKPMFGDEYFGSRLAEILAIRHGKESVVVIPDGGFGPEISPLLRAGHDVIVIRLHREGFTFAGDSRKYIESDGSFKTVGITLTDGDIEGAVNSVVEAIKLAVHLKV